MAMSLYSSYADSSLIARFIPKLGRFAAKRGLWHAADNKKNIEYYASVHSKAKGFDSCFPEVTLWDPHQDSEIQTIPVIKML